MQCAKSLLFVANQTVNFFCCLLNLQNKKKTENVLIKHKRHGHVKSLRDVTEAWIYDAIINCVTIPQSVSNKNELL